MSWPVCNLGELVKIETGKLDANAAKDDGIYPFFTCSRNTLQIDQYAFDADAIVVAGNGDLNVKHYRGKFNAYQRTYVLTPKNAPMLDSRFLYYFMDKYVERLRELSIGGVIKYIKLGMLADAVIPLPPIEEQKQIAGILDRADAIRRKRQQAIQIADEFLGSVFLDMFGDPVANPKEWSIVELGSVLETIDSGTSPKCESRQPDAGEWGVLKLGAVTYCNYNPAESKAMFPGDTPNKKDEVHAGDLLFTRKNTYELVGASAIVESTPPNLLMPDLIFRLQTKNIINKYYLWALLTHPGMRARVQSLASGAAGSMPNISKQSLKGLKIPLPPIALQYTYQDIHLKTGSIKRKFDMASAHFIGLSNALSYKAFAGEL